MGDEFDGALATIEEILREAERKNFRYWDGEHVRWGMIKKDIGLAVVQIREMQQENEAYRKERTRDCPHDNRLLCELEKMCEVCPIYKNKLGGGE